jgi:hypothetical protein
MIQNNMVPEMLQKILEQQGRTTPSPEESALVQASQGQPIQVAEGDQRGLLQRIFGGRPAQQPPMPIQPNGQSNPQYNPAAPAEGLAEPGSIADQLRKRREAADQAGGQVSMVPDDMQVAANDTGTRSDANGDRYGGVSGQTRAAMDQLGRGDPTGDFKDAIIGNVSSPQSAGYAAKTTTRGAQTSAQEQQLIRMLINQGMKESDARARARSIK